MGISSIITHGLGTWGSPSLMLTLGFSSSQVDASILGRWFNVIEVERDNQATTIQTARAAMLVEGRTGGQS